LLPILVVVLGCSSLAGVDYFDHGVDANLPLAVGCRQPHEQCHCPVDAPDLVFSKKIFSLLVFDSPLDWGKELHKH
jgi:hypothetical protein